MRQDVPPSTQAAKLAALAVALGARDVPGWSASEEFLTKDLAPAPARAVAAARTAIAAGADPLGDAYCMLHTPEERRPMGATYTPPRIVEAMLAWAAGQRRPARVVDPGAGSARFLVAAGRHFPKAQLVAVEVDPLPAILARGHLAAAGLAGRAEVRVGDFRAERLPAIEGRTLYLGNPPYVRHHLLGAEWKTWLGRTAAELGFEASQLAGLHVHFFLAIAAAARAGDSGVLITAAEWLDVNYGRLVRELLIGPLGVRNLQVIEPTAQPFPDADSTAVITCFDVGARPRTVGTRRIVALDDLGTLKPERQVRRERLEAAVRWTPLTRAAAEVPEGYVELGELCRVHRGQVTGANEVWIAGSETPPLPESVLYPTVTRARELFATGLVLADASPLRRVIDLPVDLDELERDDRRLVEKFLRHAERLGARDSFIARHRKAWWAVGLREPAPILATYMARRPPAFVMNAADARHINIAHGLYPREDLEASVLEALANYLSRATSVAAGRTYAGGLTKFEPREMERLMVPSPALLAQAAGGTA